MNDRNIERHIRVADEIESMKLFAAGLIERSVMIAEIINNELIKVSTNPPYLGRFSIVKGGRLTDYALVSIAVDILGSIDLVAKQYRRDGTLGDNIIYVPISKTTLETTILNIVSRTGYKKLDVDVDKE